jgi:hypothetical protein
LHEVCDCDCPSSDLVIFSGDARCDGAVVGAQEEKLLIIQERFSGKARQSSSGDIFRCGRKCSRVSDSVRFSCGFHKEFLSSTVCAQPAIDFLLRGCDCRSRVSPAQMCDVLNALLDCRRVDVSGG